MRYGKDELLKIRDLRTYFYTHDGIVRAVDGIDLDIKKGETFCLVGESGSGKTVTAHSIMRLVDYPGKIISGEIRFYGKGFQGEDLLKLSKNEMRKVRGGKIAMIFQDPKNSLNPVIKVGDQIVEQIREHTDLSKKEAKDRAIKLMEDVGIPDAEKRVNDYPHQFSGGMNQRIMIAMALSCEPDLLIADEPTSALDVTTQAEIMELLTDLKKREDMSILFISHDLALVSTIADEIAVMYAGHVVERGVKKEILQNPIHPYSQGLISCLPTFSKEKLESIPGQVPSLIEEQEGCIFYDRCEEYDKIKKLHGEASRCQDVCKTHKPEEIKINENHFVSCHSI